MKTVKLTIQKKYFDLIASGEKTSEYRSCTPRYKNIFDKNPDTLILHYFHGEELTAQIKKIEIIDSPDFLKETGIQFTEQVYKIDLVEPKVTLNKNLKSKIDRNDE